MERTIDDLFKKIYQSESLAQKRNNLKTELKQAVQQTTNELKDLQDECLSLQGQLMLKQQKLTEEELNSKWLTRQEELLKEQKDSLQKQIETLRGQKLELEEKLLSEERIFCEELEKFSSKFDLSGTGCRQRELQKEDILRKLQEEENNLKESLNKYNERQEKIGELSVEKEDLHKQLRQLQEKNQDLSDLLEKEVTATLTLEEEKDRILNRPRRDPDFISLQRELATAKGEKLEERCNQLQKEYQQLQQQLWQRKRQQRQQQLKQQYQGKQQYTHPVSQNTAVNNNNRTASQDTEDDFNQDMWCEIFSDSDHELDQDDSQKGNQQTA